MAAEFGDGPSRKSDGYSELDLILAIEEQFLVAL